CSRLCAAPTPTYTLSLHDALPISWTYLRRVPAWARPFRGAPHVRERLLRAQGALLREVRATVVGVGEALVAPDGVAAFERERPRSEEHTSELQSRENLVCRLLLEK